MVSFRRLCRQIEAGQAAFMVMVPLGMLLQRACAPLFFPQRTWEKVQRTKARESRGSKLKARQLAYTLCHAAAARPRWRQRPSS